MLLLFPLSAYALFDQLRIIFQRKKSPNLSEGASEVVSLNRTLASFMAFFANFLLGISYDNFDFYLVGTRSIALILLLLTFFEIFKDRKNISSLLVLFGTLFALFTVSLIATYDRNILISHLALAKSYSVFAACMLAQGYIHQIYLLRKSKKIGGLSVLSFKLYLTKEITMIAFALTLGFDNGWPLLLMHGSVIVFILILLWNVRLVSKCS